MATNETHRGLIQPAGAGERVLAMGALVTIAVPADATGGRVAVIEHVVPPTGGPPPHTHTVCEILYVLDGEFDVWLDDLTTPTRAATGATIVVPPDVPHTTRNAGERAARLLSLYLPGGDEGFFAAMGTPVDALPAPPDLNTPPDLSGLDIARVRAVAAQYGMHLIPPAPPANAEPDNPDNPDNHSRSTLR